jgi:hypothetical protein
MCRYAFKDYKPHYACFDCRKTFKRRHLSDFEETKELSLKEAKCPQCGNLVANMGMDFQAPRKDDIKAWKHIQQLYSVGIAFHSCGCSGPGYIPNDRQALITYLEGIKKGYNKQLEFWTQYKVPANQKEADRNKNKNPEYIERVPLSKKRLGREEEINFWISMIKEVEDQLKTLK